MNDDEQCPVCGRRRILKKVCYDPNSVFTNVQFVDNMNIQWRIVHMKN